MVIDQKFGEVPPDRGQWKRRPGSKPKNWDYKTHDFSFLEAKHKSKPLMTEQELSEFIEKRREMEQINYRSQSGR